MNTEIVANQPDKKKAPVISVNEPITIQFYAQNTNPLNGAVTNLETRIARAMNKQKLNFHGSNTNTPGRFMYTVWCNGLLEASRLGAILSKEGYPML